jgi:nitric oxide reductase NorD protein
LELNWTAADTDAATDLSRMRAEEVAPLILQAMEVEYPKVYALYESLMASYQLRCVLKKQQPDYSWFYGKWMKNSAIYDEGLSKENDLTNRQRPIRNHDPTTTINAKGVEQINSLQIDKKQQEDYMLNHNFEKVETAEEFSGVWRDFDGDDQLDEHQDALDELNMRYSVRVDEPVHSVYQAEFIENSSVVDSKDLTADKQYILYPEWHYKKKLYREGYCRVYPTVVRDMDTNYYHTTIADHQAILVGLRKKLTSINNRWQEQRRQSDGKNFDLDATIDMYSDIHAGKTPSDRIYLSDRKMNKDLSILLLLDTSMSSDSYVSGNKIIEVEKQVSVLFGEILAEFSVDFSIATFHSQTRNFSSYDVLKSFDEDWNIAKYRIGAIRPNGYTRIGAALRHAGSMLAPRTSKSKWVLLLSDGKPNDYDRYEGRYGIEDVRKALGELNHSQINSYALAIEAQARYYLPQMFGQNHYKILQSASELLVSLVQLFEKIKHHS